eukprot:TRINITY_DN15052_c0_g1_i1.p1 TRINITY_DN15052_c0_g1~~TRINITY_DN15052_c0_g1_i1.p1  ORF type:complete len:208 (-),score=32.02 TRINITY_DN15052_c0_g1_i1:52-675(-)
MATEGSRHAPEVVALRKDVHFPKLIWDITRIAPGLKLERGCTVVKQVNAAGTHKPIFALWEAPTTGLHFYQMKVENAGPSNCVMIGLGSSVATMASTYPGDNNDSGVSYYGANGYRYYSNTYAGYGPTFTTGDVIGVLLNLNHRTVTFFKNDECVGTAADASILKEGVLYYPICTLYQEGSQVALLDTVVPVAQQQQDSQQLSAVAC